MRETSPAFHAAAHRAFPFPGQCAITVQPWNTPRTTAGPGAYRASRNSLSPGCPRNGQLCGRRPKRRCLAVLSCLLAAANIPALQVNLYSLRLLHVLCGLLLDLFPSALRPGKVSAVLCRTKKECGLWPLTVHCNASQICGISLNALQGASANRIAVT